MKAFKNIKQLLAVLVMLGSVNTYAGVCNNGSVKGLYNFSVTGVRFNDSFHIAGRVVFNGMGLVSFSGVITEMGGTSQVVGNGTYQLIKGCRGNGSLNFDNGFSITYWLFLDQLDTAPAINVAYHGTVAAEGHIGNIGSSASGELHRVRGKFQ
jgi:hypothetical protein